MPTYGNGSWFHSRVSSSEGERESIVKLVENSKKYVGLRWSGKKTSTRNIQFAKEIGVKPAQMQTKIRAFIRLGFIKDKPNCPLEWTMLGEIWRRLILEAGDTLKPHTSAIEQIIIASSLALYSFDNSGFSSRPDRDYRPFFELLKNLDSNGFISKDSLKSLIGNRNYTYWVIDFKRGGILEENNNGFILVNKFPNLFNAVKTISLSSLNESDWKSIRDNVLDKKNPFRDAILSDMEKILEGIIDIETLLPLSQQEIVSEIISTVDIKEEEEIDSANYKVEDSYSRAKKRRKQSAWSKKIKSNYNFICCVPECDVNTAEFVIAAHIKKYSEPEGQVGHRANPHNGLCLCSLCHKMFDRGCFTLTDDLKIRISPSVSNITSNRLKEVILKSNGKRIKLPHRFRPDVEFIAYHREHIFKT